MYRKTTCAAFVALLISPTFVQAQTIYKCPGDRGETIFSQMPCSDDAEIVDVGPTNGATPVDAPERAFRDRSPDSRRNRTRASNDVPDYICRGARDDVRNLQERWDNVKRGGYTPDQQRSYEQRLRERKRHAENVCR